MENNIDGVMIHEVNPFKNEEFYMMIIFWYFNSAKICPIYQN